MSPLLSYAGKSLRKNRTRTIVTILGIMMSAALIVALATLGTSLYRYMQEGYIYENGDWHLGITNGTGQDVQAIRMEPDTENAVLAKSIGYARIEGAAHDKPYLYLQGVEQKYYEHMGVHLTEGRLPEGEGELLLPESFRRAVDGGCQTGSVMALEVGLRQKDGQVLWQHVSYGTNAEGFSSAEDREEVLRQLQSLSYTVVGFYEATNTGIGAASGDMPGYTALTWWNGEVVEDGCNRFSVWFQIPGVGNNKFHGVYDKLRLMYDYNGRQLSVNLGLLSLYGVRISATGESTAVIAVVVILLFIILVGSVMLIYNAFAISVGERTKQFGLLSSIGATRKQIRGSVLYEAAIVGGIGTFLGVFAGIAIVAAVLKAAGTMVAELMEFSVKPHLYVWLPAVLLAVLVAILTVLVSAWIPAKRATKVTAIEAIRQSREFHYSGKQKKVPRLVEALFGYEGTLAVIYSGRNRKRYRVTTVALFLSMVLFVSINAFSSYMMTVVQAEYKASNYDVLVQILPEKRLSEEERQELAEILRGQTGVESVVQPTYIGCRMPLEENESHVTREFRESLEDAVGKNKSSVGISVVDDESFSAFCREHGLEEERFLDTENLTVIVNNSFKAIDRKSGNTKLIEGLLEEDGRFYVDLASNFYMEDYKANIVEFTAGYYAESLAAGCNDNWNLSVMLPESVAKELGLKETADSSLTFCLNTANHRKTTEELKELLGAKYPDSTVYDQAERQAGDRNLIFLLKLLANGFIIMIAVISMANVFSTISSGLKLRQKEFAMLKTVGMTQGGLQRMMNLECLLYGGKAVLFGLPASVLVAAVMYYFFRKDVIFDFYLPVQSILIAIGSIFGVVFVTMLYTIGRMKKENVIDVLKQENF
ncbi:MAG: ABC transporter permease [Lachnospiraceae bacterium]|nr:ABC transporter permease [Lachnospiraceae bacterium]